MRPLSFVLLGTQAKHEIGGNRETSLASHRFKFSIVWLSALLSSVSGCRRARALLGASVQVKTLLRHAIEGEGRDGAFQAWSDNTPWAVRTTPAGEVFVFCPDHVSFHWYTLVCGLRRKQTSSARYAAYGRRHFPTEQKVRKVTRVLRLLGQCPEESITAGPSKLRVLSSARTHFDGKPRGTRRFGVVYGLKSNGLVASIWLKIVSPLEDDVACVTVKPVSEYKMALALPPTSAIGTVSVIVP